VSKRDRLKLTPDLTTRWATGNDNFVCSSLWDFKSYFTCRKILRHRTFPLYFPSERKVCCGFLSPLKIHRLGQVLNPQPLGSSGQHTNHYTTKATVILLHILYYIIIYNKVHVSMYIYSILTEYLINKKNVLCEGRFT
jgi:hypothetical protein